MDYSVVKIFHILFAIISISGFIARGLFALRQSAVMQQRWIKVIPHINDTLLLISALTMMYLHQLSLWQNPWLLAKIIALLVYIGLGVVALRLARQQSGRVAALLGAIATFAYIVAVAITKNPCVIL